MDKIKVLDKTFKKSIPEEEILKSIDQIAEKINSDYQDKEIFFLVILNGAFMFASDLIKRVHCESIVSFVKLASYQGTTSTEKVVKLIGLNESLSGKNVVVVEDIVDTGITLDNLLKELETYNPESVKIATMLYKPESFQKDYTVDYVGMEIPNDFIVGYGLDYDGYARNYPDIYKISE
jgi:hypoxanthine phosphoribosyltransferase